MFKFVWYEGMGADGGVVDSVLNLHNLKSLFIAAMTDKNYSEEFLCDESLKWNANINCLVQE